MKGERQILDYLLIHDYFGVDVQVVWRTVHEALPPLRKAIARLIAEIEAEAE